MSSSKQTITNITLANFSLIENIYGRRFAVWALEELAFRAASYGKIVEVKNHTIHLDTVVPNDGSTTIHRQIGRLNNLLSSVPAYCGSVGLILHVIVSLHTQTKAGLPSTALDTLSAVRTDMAQAVELYQALADQNLHLILEPVVDTDNYEVAYYEALVRNNEGKSFGPKIAAAERLGISQNLDWAVIAQTINFLANNQYNIRVGCNVSPSSLSESWFKQIINELQIKPKVASQLIFEFTERMPVSLEGSAIKIIRNLKELGVTIVLDDFGSGYWNFSNALDIEPSYIKLDKLLLARARGSKLAAHSIKHILDYVQSLGATAIIEGVESSDDIEVAKKFGVRLVQGFYLSRRPFNPKIKITPSTSTASDQ